MQAAAMPRKRIESAGQSPAARCRVWPTSIPRSDVKSLMTRFRRSEIEKHGGTMTFARLFTVAVLGWVALVLVAALQTPSYAQSGPGSPELPYVGLTTTDQAAFQIVN